jgi:hypothetical protein
VSLSDLLFWGAILTVCVAFWAIVVAVVVG